VVCEPKEALDCFLCTQMDVLVMGDTMLVRAGGVRWKVDEHQGPASAFQLKSLQQRVAQDMVS
jgi:hypothetical protein